MKSAVCYVLLYAFLRAEPNNRSANDPAMICTPCASSYGSSFINQAIKFRTMEGIDRAGRNEESSFSQENSGCCQKVWGNSLCSPSFLAKSISVGRLHRRSHYDQWAHGFSAWVAWQNAASYFLGALEQYLLIRYERSRLSAISCTSFSSVLGCSHQSGK